MLDAVCQLGLEGIVSKKLNAPYRSGPSRTWIKVKNPKAPVATNDPVRGPDCLVPPWLRTVGEPRTPRLFHLSEWLCISQNFSDRRARAAKRKGQASGDQPGPNDRASRASSFPSAVLKPTFAELLRSCSRNHRGAGLMSRGAIPFGY
jgi:hypothetical protein